MKLLTLCRAANLVCPAGAEETEICGIASDSACVGPRFLFVCVKGLHADGHDYVAQAIARGAVCVVAQEGRSVPTESDVIVLYSASPRSALARLWNAWYGFPAEKMHFIGVTGTNGKTTVTHLLRAVFEGALHRCGVIGTVGCLSAGRELNARGRNALANMTTPEPEELYRVLAEMAEDGVEYVLMEVTSHALVSGRVAPIYFDVGIFTNLTPEHLDFHGSMEEYAKAKALLLQQCECAIINMDSPYGAFFRKMAQRRVITCSAMGTDSDFYAQSVEADAENGISYRLRADGLSVNIHCPITGFFNVTNSMQAAVCALHCGIRPSAVQSALASVGGIKGRMESVRLGLGADFTVLIDYAHTPDALENLLKSVGEMKQKGQRIVLLFGCGGDRDRTKRPVMGRIAATLADSIILTSDNSRSEEPEQIIREILTGIPEGADCRVIVERKAAIEDAVLHAKAGDILLLAGKGHEEYEITREGRRPFSEREIVKSAFSKRQQRKHLTEDTETEEQL